MVAFTTPDGFAYETPSDRPNITLSGGPTGDESPILAEQVQTKFQTVDADIATLQSRVTALEDGTSGQGWIHVNNGNDSGATVTIDATDSGKFVAGEFTMLHLHARYDLNAAGSLNMQINGDSDSVYRSGGAVLDAEGDVDGATFDPVNWHIPSGTAWRISHGATIGTNSLNMWIFLTSGSFLLPFQAFSTRNSDNSGSTVHRGTFAWGDLTSGKLISTLVLGAEDGASNIDDMWWRLAGYRL